MKFNNEGRYMTVKEYLEELVNSRVKRKAFMDKIAMVHEDVIYDCGLELIPHYTTMNGTFYTFGDKLTGSKVWFTEENERYSLDEDITDEGQFIKYIADYFHECHIEYFETKKKKLVEEYKKPFKLSICLICSVVFFAGLLVYFNFFSTQWANEASNLAIYNDYLVAKDSINSVVDGDTAFADSMFGYYSDSLNGAIVEAKPIKVSKRGGYWYTAKKVITNDDFDCVKACKREYSGNLEIACLSKCVTVRVKYEDEWMPVRYDTTWSKGIMFNCKWRGDNLYRESKDEYVKNEARKLVDSAIVRYKNSLTDSIKVAKFEFKPDEYRALHFDDEYTLEYLKGENQKQVLLNIFWIIGICILIVGLIVLRRNYLKPMKNDLGFYNRKLETLKNG